MRTNKEVNAVLSAQELQNPDTLHLIELILDPLDLPAMLVNLLGHFRGQATIDAMKEAGFKI